MCLLGLLVFGDGDDVTSAVERREKTAARSCTAHRITSAGRARDATRPQVQEAMLTGESVPVSKNLAPVAEASGLGDRKCMAFSATTVSAGQGLGVVVATGGPAARALRCNACAWSRVACVRGQQRARGAPAVGR